jgi:putative nucleotidyltransferase with HDIG domain
MPRPPSSRLRGSFDSWSSWLREVFADRPDRFSHSLAVAHRAALHARIELRKLEPVRLERLVLGALLHDVGRAIDPADTEPHGFVGARFLDEIGLHDVAPFAAHHSGARHEAELRGMSHLDAWTTIDPELQAVLTHIDRTTSSDGEPVTLGERRTELVARYGDGSCPVRVFDHSLVEAAVGARVLRDLSGRSPLLAR